jgi:hypothetical protein
MSDSLAERTLQQTSDNGNPGGASEQEQGSTSAQTSNNGQSEKTEKDNVRALQSVYDKKLADIQRQLQVEQNARLQAQKRMEELEDASAPDDYSRLANTARRAQERAAQLEAYLVEQQRVQAEANKRNDLISNLAIKYGVDPSTMAKAEDYDEAVELAIEARNKQRAKQSADRQDKDERNSLDLGGGRAATSYDNLEDELKKAKERRDSPAIIKIQRLMKQQQAADAKR